MPNIGLLNISARNQLPGKVVSIKRNEITAIVDIKLTNGFFLTSLITDNAVIDLDLQLDDEVVAFFKATDVILSKEKDYILSARNIFTGKCISIENDNVYGIDCNGCTFYAKITSKSADNLHNIKDFPLDVIIKSSNIMIAKRKLLK